MVSAHGANFVKTMLRLGRERDTLRVVADQIGGPTPAAAIADTLLTAARAMVGGQAGETYHFAGASDTNWAAFARAVMEEAGLACRIEETALITTPDDQEQFLRLLGDGSQWGLSFTYIVQPSPDGLAQAYLLAKHFLAGAPSAMVLGDNIFFGHGLPEILAAANARTTGGTVFGYHVADPERYGVVEFDESGNVRAILEKPKIPPSSYAVTGLYFLDGRAPELAALVKPSPRGELEIVCWSFTARRADRGWKMGRGFAWLDTETHASLLDAGNFFRTLMERQGLQVGSPEEIAYRAGWIDRESLSNRAELFKKNEYGAYLGGLLG